MPPKRKRAPAAPSGKPPAAKRGKAVRVAAGASRTVAVKADPVPSSSVPTNAEQEKLRERFIALFADTNHEVSNRSLKETFGDSEYLQLVPIINELTQKARLIMSKKGDELYYTLVSDETAAKWAGLDLTARMVFQTIEKAGNMGIWTKDIRTQTNIQQQALNKIFKVSRILRRCCMFFLDAVYNQ